MADFVTGKVNLGNSAKSADALGVSSTLTRTQFFQNAVSNPQQKKEFIDGLKLRQEQALANNNKTMFDLLGKLINATKEQDVASSFAQNNTSNFFAIG